MPVRNNKQQKPKIYFNDVGVEKSWLKFSSTGNKQ